MIIGPCLYISNTKGDKDDSRSYQLLNMQKNIEKGKLKQNDIN